MTHGMVKELFEEAKKKGFETFMYELEEALIARAIADSKYSYTEAAEMLQMNRTTLVMKRKKFGFLK